MELFCIDVLRVHHLNRLELRPFTTVKIQFDCKKLGAFGKLKPSV